MSWLAISSLELSLAILCGTAEYWTTGHCWWKSTQLNNEELDCVQGVIHESHPGFEINPYSDPTSACRITPKTLWIYYLVGVSHFAECHETRPVTAWEILTHLLHHRYSTMPWRGKCRVIMNPYLGLHHHQQLSDSKFQWNWLITFGVILLTDRQTDRQYNRTTCLSLADITSVSETIRKALLVKAQTALKNKKKQKKIKFGEKRFSIWRMESLHPAMWHVALESWQWIHQVAAPCNVIRGSGMTCHWIRPNVRHIGILHLFSILTISPQSTCHSAPVCEILFKSDNPRQKKMTSCRFSRWRISAILDFRGPIMGSLNSPCMTSYWSFLHFGDRQTDRQTNRRTDGQAGCMKLAA